MLVQHELSSSEIDPACGFDDFIGELTEENLIEKDDSLRGGAQAPSAFAATAEAAPNNSTNASSAVNSDQTLLESGLSPTAALLAENDSDYYRRRAVEEVASLQLVENIISGVEREHMKMSPATFDDLRVRKALHTFQKVSAIPESAEHLEAEGNLIHETESWCNALAARDREISVANIRRFCEDSRPALSSQALIALGRFYRIAPFSEPVRAKFDFVITRLFSKEVANERRRLLFTHEEMLRHLGDLYESWESITMFETVTDPQRIAAAVETFRHFGEEVKAAKTFADLVVSRFFNRVREFKETTAETFFAPEVTVAAIECNTVAGNRFVELIEAEKAKADPDSLTGKFGFALDSLASAAAGRTLLIGEIYKRHLDIDEEFAAQAAAGQLAPNPQIRPMSAGRAWPAAPGRATPAVSPVVLISCVAALLLTFGLYLWTDSGSVPDIKYSVAPTVDVENSEIKTYLKLARSSGDTFYGVVTPSWQTMTDDERKAVLAKTISFAAAKNLKKVDLMNESGRSVAFGSADRSQILSP